MKKITNFLFELGMLSREKHAGYYLIGVENPDSIAEHSWRASVIAYILADLEGANPEKSACMCLIHDIEESRLRDLHKVSARYMDSQKAKEMAFEEQMANLSESVRKKWNQYNRQFNQRDVQEGIVARDADWLEMALKAREYVCLGYKGAQNWIDNVRIALETESAKKLLAEIETSDINDWWQGLKKMTYNKLK